MRKPFADLLVLLTALLGFSAASATELYRYVNDKGVVVLDRLGVPPAYVAKGYEVLNEQGRVIRVVPPAPTAEEMKHLLAERARAGSDMQLLRLYSTPEDVDRAKERKLAELDGLISVASSNLLSLRTQQSNLQAQAAEHERAGREVPDHLIAQIENLKSEQANLRRNIASFRDARVKSADSFDADRDRLRELLERRR